jgi:hypothetical protein
LEEDRDAVEIHIVQRHIERVHGNQLLCVDQYLSGKEKAAENELHPKSWTLNPTLGCFHG